MPTTHHKTKLQSTTVRLPRGLYEQAMRALENGETMARSLNELLVYSLGEKLQQIERAAIDEEFAAMLHDEKHQRESEKLTRQFASNDAETLRSRERSKR